MGGAIMLHARRRQRAFTAVEMVVTLAAGSVLLAAILITQLRLSQHSSRITDSATRDNEIRTALDVMNRDISGAGFLLEAAAPPVCNQVLAYNSSLTGMQGNVSTTVPPGYFVLNTAMSFPANAGAKLPIADLTFNYPPTSPTPPNRSDALVIRVTNGASVLNGNSYGTLKAKSVGNPASTGPPASNGQFTLQPVGMPFLTASAFGEGNVALVRVQNGLQPICVRVPIKSLTLTVTPPTLTLAGTSLMPSTYFQAFATEMARFGLPPNGISNQNLAGPGAGASASLTDLGAPAVTTQFGYVYYISLNTAMSGNLANVPVLQRVQINSLDDSVIQIQDIAYGVVSLQVNFGVDTSLGANGGAVTQYLSGAAVQAQNLGAWIRTVRMLIVTRSLNPDPTFLPAAAGGASGPHFSNEAQPELDLKAQFPNPLDATKPLYTNYTIAPVDYGYHFTAQEQEIALRNQAWIGTWSANLN